MPRGKKRTILPVPEVYEGESEIAKEIRTAIDKINELDRRMSLVESKLSDLWELFNEEFGEDFEEEKEDENK